MNIKAGTAKKNDSRIIKKGRVLALALFTLLSFSIPFMNIKNVNAVVIDQVIAVVNKTPITLYDFAKFNRPAFEEYEQMQEHASHGIFTKDDSSIMTDTKGVIDILVNNALLKQEEERAAIYVSPKQLNGYVKNVALANNFTVPQFFNFLKKRGINKTAYIKQVRNSITRIELLRKVYGNKMYITPKELINYYKKNIEEFRGMPMVDLKMIFLGVPQGSDGHVRKNIYNRMLKIRNLALKGGLSFSSLARKYSEDPSEKNGGRLGYIYKDKLSPGFSETAFKLKVGQISEVIKTSFGYTILKSVGKKIGAIKTFKEVKPQIFSVLEKNKTDKYLAKLLKKARKNAYIKIKIPV